MQAVTFDPEKDNFMVKELPVPSPGPEDVLIPVEACGLNPVDAKIIHWKDVIPSMTNSWVPGLDVYGYIEAVGGNVDQ